MQMKKRYRTSDASDTFTPPQLAPHPVMQGHGVLKPQPVSNGLSRPPRTVSSSTQQWREQPQAQPQEEEQPPIDPNLFSMYTENDNDNNDPYNGDGYGYNYEQGQSQQGNYFLPSLEQIANEVLVDMNGNETQDPRLQQEQAPTLDGAADIAPMSNENSHTKTNESIDSAVSLSAAVHTDSVSDTAPGIQTQETNPPIKAEGPITIPREHNELPPAHPSIETNGTQPKHEPPVPTSPARPKSGASDLPLYKPPRAPLTISRDSKAPTRPTKRRAPQQCEHQQRQWQQK